MPAFSVRFRLFDAPGLSGPTRPTRPVSTAFPPLTGSFAGAVLVLRTTSSWGIPPVFLTENETNPLFALSGLGRTLNSLSRTETEVFEPEAPIGLATIAAAIGAGGLGVLIYRGIAIVDNRLILAGALPAALLALGVDVLLGAVERRWSPSRPRRTS